MRNSSFATTRAKSLEALLTSSSASLAIIIADRVQGVTKVILASEENSRTSAKASQLPRQIYGLMNHDLCDATNATYTTWHTQSCKLTPLALNPFVWFLAPRPSDQTVVIAKFLSKF